METRGRGMGWLLAALLIVGAGACVKKLDVSKVRCTDTDHCPSGNTCLSGSCIPNSSLGGMSQDGPSGGYDVSPSRDGKGGSDSSTDGAGGAALDGATPDVPSGGGNVGNPDGLATGGSGGAGGTGGTGGALDASMADVPLPIDLGGACSEGATCTPNNNPCQTGKVSCATGTAVCGNPVNVADGTPTICGSGKVCKSGACNPCTEGGSCTGDATDPCHTYAISCTTGDPICKVSGSKPNTTPCGPAQSCTDGIEHDQATCNNGTCPAVQPTRTCPSTGCNSAGTACASGCSAAQTVCGSSCCEAGQTCFNGSCCTLATCGTRVCGSPSNGCGGTLTCGTCPSGKTCDASGACVCGSGTDCGTAGCVDTSSDNNNCGGCGKACGSGKRCSGGTCVCANTNDSCGTSTSCTSCSSTGKVCSGGSCLCPTGTFDCGGTSGCTNVNGSDPNHCGSCANVCGHDMICQTGNCACVGYSFGASCGGCGNWTFESGTIEGWTSLTSTPQWVQTPVQSGTGALAVPVTGSATVNVSLCTSGAAIDVSNLTMKAYVRLSNAGIGVLSALLFEAGSAGGVNASSAVGFGTQLSSDAAAGQWPSTPFSYTFPPGTLASYVSIRLAPSPAWNGTMYIDTVQISP